MIRIGIVGYGNLARGVEAAVRQHTDMELKAVFSRRDPAQIRLQSEAVPVIPLAAVKDYTEQIDVMILCGGSAADLPQMTPDLAKYFHVVDSFDTHAKIPEHAAAVEQAALEGKKLALISAGWDPGLFSLNRLYAAAVLPQGRSYTFWGKGVSQGHSDAIRRIPGVADARQYTIPTEEAMQRVRDGEQPNLSGHDSHSRLCYVVTEEGADQAQIEEQIKTMPHYFADYQTTVCFISQEELDREHSGLPHGGSVIHSARTGMAGEHHAAIEYRLELDSNPEFTACVLLAAARAVYRMAGRGRYGCLTMFDLAPADMSMLSREELLGSLL